MKRLELLLAAVPLLAGNLLNNQGGTALPANAWTALSPSGYPSFRIVGWEKFLYVPQLRSACGYAMYREISSEPNHAWMCYSLRENRWTVISETSTYDNEHFGEGGHPVAGMGVDPNTGVAYGACCFSGGSVSEIMRGTYMMDFSAQTGRVLQSTSGININTMQPNGAFDPLRHKMVLHGGTSFAGTAEYSIANNTWTNGITCADVASNCPGHSVLQAGMDFNSHDGLIYLFGGSFGGVLQNGVYAYNPTTQTWVNKNPTGTPPSARQEMGWVYMSGPNKFLMYGGGDDCCSNIHNDTWIYDPVANSWAQLSPITNPTAGTSSIFERMAYFPEDDVVVMMTLDLSGSHLYAFRYQPGGNAGIVSNTYTATTGGINRNSNSWAMHPTSAANSTTLYQAWTESGSESDTTNSKYFKGYARSFNIAGSTSANLGSAYNSLANAVDPSESNDVSVALVGSTLWGCWHEQDNSTLGLDKLVVKKWTGSAWSGGLLGKATTGATAYTQGQCQIVDVGGVPHMIFREHVNDTTPSIVYAYVYKTTDGSTWTKVGTALNRDGSGGTKSRVRSVAITGDGTNPCAAWTEDTITAVTNGITNTVPQAYVSCWNGSAWSAKGGEANVSTSNRANAISITYLGGQPYVAFTERTATGPSTLYVRTYNGSWSTVGSAMNRDATNGWAFRPELKTDGTDLYLIWDEQGNNVNWEGTSSALLPYHGSLAQKPQVYASKYSGGTWTKLGGSLNADTTGAAEHPTLALASTTPVATWSEVQYGTSRQIYTAKYNGTDWASLTAPPVPPTITTTSLPGGTVGAAYSQTLTATGDAPITWTLASGSLPLGLTLSSGGTISGTPTTSGTPTFVVQAANGVSPNATQSLSIAIINPPSITTTSLPPGMVGVAYSQTLTATGDTPISWSVTVGSLPAGLSLVGAVISGTPTTAGSSTFTVQASNGATDSKALGITISAPPLSHTGTLSGVLR